MTDQSDQYDAPDDPTRDPAAAPEAEGVPEVQDDALPEAERAADPQRMPTPTDVPVAAESFGTTPAEAAEGESLEMRLAEEEPDVGESPTREEEPGPVSADPDGTDDDRVPQDAPGGGPAPGAPGGAGVQLRDDPMPGRPVEQDVFATDSPAGAGESAEEAAVRIADDGEDSLGLRADDDAGDVPGP